MANEYQSYQEMLIKVNSGLEQMEKLCRQMDLEEQEVSLKAGREKLSSRKFTVGILGEFKRGKSTVINSLLEKEIVPADIIPTSATMNRITYDLEPHAEVLMKDGSVREIAVEELADYVTKLDAEKKATAANVEEAVVYYPCKFCRNGVDIVDTPGLNDEEEMDRITEQIIPKLDAVIMVLVAGVPFSRSEAEFVRNKIMASDLGKIIFIVNKIDIVRRESDKKRIVEEIRSKIQESVLDKMEEVYEKDSKEYENVRMKLGTIQVYPFSALDALEGKMDGDEVLIQKSGTVEFENALTKMLTEDRGALELKVPLNMLIGTASKVVETATVRKNALEMSQQEFEEEQKHTLQVISGEREKTKKEVKRLQGESVRESHQLQGEISGFYPGLKVKLDTVIDTYSISADDVATDAGKNKISNALSDAVFAEMQNEMCNLTERIQTRLSESLKDVAAELSVKALDSSAILGESLPGSKAVVKNSNSQFIKNTAIDILTDFVGIYGVGGALEGWEAGGAKGLLVGGGVGVAAAFLTASLIPFGFIPMTVISCAAGTAAGKQVVRTLFKKDISAREIKEIRSRMKKTVEEYLDQRIAERTLEKWIDETVIRQFNEVISAYEKQSTQMIQDAENTIVKIREDLAANEVVRRQKEKEFDTIIENATKIWTDVSEVNDKVDHVLKAAS